MTVNVPCSGVEVSAQTLTQALLVWGGRAVSQPDSEPPDAQEKGSFQI